MSLPNDVLDRILSFISDSSTLENCADSHPALSKIAERYIYASIALYNDLDTVDPWIGWNTSHFAEFLVQRPEIASYVRSLLVYWNDNPQRRQVMASSFDGIASMLPMLPGLTTIRLMAYGQYKSSWDELPETFRQAFLDLLHVRSVKNVSVSYVASFPLTLLKNCRNIRLTLQSCRELEYDGDPVEDAVEDASQSGFEHLFLKYGGTETGVDPIIAWERLHDLRSLKYTSLDITNFSNSARCLLVACSSSLTNLDLDIWYMASTSLDISETSGMEDQDYENFPFTLAGLFRLEQLTISSHLDVRPLRSNRWRHNSALPGITELISTAPPSLKRLFLNIMFAVPRPCPGIAWYPFIPLAAKCSSLAITISVSAVYSHAPGGIPRPVPLSLVDCPGLKSYVENGVFKLAQSDYHFFS